MKNTVLEKQEVLLLNKFNLAYYNPWTCKPDCPNRSPYCHNIETCEQYRKYCEHNEMTKANRRKYMKAREIIAHSVQDAKERKRKKR